VARLTAMKETVAEELARQMGRPTRFGQGEMGGVNARTDYMSEIAAETLAPMMIEDSDKLPPLSGARPWAWSSSSRLGTIPT
jgi:hypothetical protein